MWRIEPACITEMLVGDVAHSSLASPWPFADCAEHAVNLEAPAIITDSIARGVWRDPGPDVLRQLLGDGLDLPDLELFESFGLMRRVAAQLESAGYFDDPEFCMTRSAALSLGSHDPRLVYDRALFIAGSTVPGDDVFVVVDLHGEREQPKLRVLDWRVDVPNRWSSVGTLSEFVERLSRVRAGRESG